MPKDLNISCKLSKLKPIKYRDIDIEKLRSNPIVSKDDWGKNEFSNLKSNFRYSHYKFQKRRCVYCRRKLNPNGGNEHIDHIVARNISHKWMFKPKNLVLSCYQCNTQKKDALTLKAKKYYKRFPRRPRYYVLFSPYVHNWSDHFEIEDNLFLRAKSDIGENTIKKMRLYDYKYSIVYADESNSFGKTAIAKAATRMYQYSEDTIEYKSAEKLIKEIERHI